MKAITLRLSAEDLKFLRKVKEQGFASLTEVIKCATLSFVGSAPKNTNGKAA